MKLKEMSNDDLLEWKTCLENSECVEDELEIQRKWALGDVRIEMDRRGL